MNAAADCRALDEKLKVLVAGKEVGPEEQEEERRELELLQRELLEQEGIEADRMTTRLAVDEDREKAVPAAAREHDLVLIGETEPSVREKVFGDFSRRLADDADVPVVVVRREL